MKQTVRATWEILEVAYNEAKRDNTCIVFDKGAFEDCYSHFKNWRNLILSQYMKKEVEELDRHKIAAILTISIIESKAITYIGDLKDKVLFTYYEAGYGDMLMFYRYMPILTSMCKKVIIKPQKELAALFRENSYGAEVIEIFDFEKELGKRLHKIPIGDDISMAIIK